MATTYTGTKATSGRGSTVSIGSPAVLIGEMSDYTYDFPEW